MSSFSERQGIKPPKESIQVDSMDDDLRSSLWNVFVKFYKGRPGTRIRGSNVYINDSDSLFCTIWTDYYKKPMDDLTYLILLEEIKKLFFESNWNEVYDFIEFVVNNYGDSSVNMSFTAECNKILEREKSGYRFINNQIAPITNAIEISSIQQVLTLPNTLSTVKSHISRATDLLSDRTSPDYRNSIKEAISGLEALCRIISQKPNATLADTLK